MIMLKILGSSAVLGNTFDFIRRSTRLLCSLTGVGLSSIIRLNQRNEIYADFINFTFH